MHIGFDTRPEERQLGPMAKAENASRDSRRKRGGRIPGTGGHPAFSLTLPDPSPIPVLIAAPHGGRSYPAEISARMRNPVVSSLRLEDRFTDLLAEAVARETGAALLVSHAPRAIIDLNRAPDDMDWEMVADGPPAGRARLAAGRRARSGLGLVPRRLPGLGEVWRKRMTQAELDARIEHVHRPYHAALADTLETLRDQWEGAVLLDLHSMPPLGSRRGGTVTPDFVIGDRFGAACHPGFVSLALSHFAEQGREAAHNQPYAGGYVLDRHAAPTRAIHALQLEICRSTYLDQDLREPGPGMARVVSEVAGLVRRLAGEVAGARRLPQAAE